MQKEIVGREVCSHAAEVLGLGNEIVGREVCSHAAAKPPRTTMQMIQCNFQRNLHCFDCIASSHQNDVFLEIV